MWRVVKSKFLQLSSDFIEIFKSYYLQAFNYWRDSDQHQLCLMTTSLKFGIPLSKVFLDQKFYGDSKKLVRKKWKSVSYLRCLKRVFSRSYLTHSIRFFPAFPSTDQYENYVCYCCAFVRFWMYSSADYALKCSSLGPVTIREKFIGYM